MPVSRAAETPRAAPVAEGVLGGDGLVGIHDPPALGFFLLGAAGGRPSGEPRLLSVPYASSAEELLAYLQADGVVVKPRRGPSGDLLGYAVGRPGDLNKDGEQIFHPGGKVAPDLTLPKLQGPP